MFKDSGEPDLLQIFERVSDEKNFDSALASEQDHDFLTAE